MNSTAIGFAAFDWLWQGKSVVEDWASALWAWSFTIAAKRTGRGATRMDAAERQEIAATLAGDGDAYARLIVRHQARVAAHMWRFTRNRVIYEELVQDVFVEAYLNLRKFRGDASWEHWLLKIATRVGYRYWKQQARERGRGTLPLLDHDTAATAPAAGSAKEAAEQVHQLLAQLAPRDRLVLTLIYLEGCTIDEAAQLAGWSRTMTKVQAHRARGKLRKIAIGCQLSAISQSKS